MASIGHALAQVSPCLTLCDQNGTDLWAEVVWCTVHSDVHCVHRLLSRHCSAKGTAIECHCNSWFIELSLSHHKRNLKQRKQPGRPKDSSRGQSECSSEAKLQHMQQIGSCMTMSTLEHTTNLFVYLCKAFQHHVNATLTWTVLQGEARHARSAIKWLAAERGTSCPG
jgi:hypothetical protein